MTWTNTTSLLVTPALQPSREKYSTYHSVLSHPALRTSPGRRAAYMDRRTTIDQSFKPEGNDCTLEFLGSSAAVSQMMFVFSLSLDHRDTIAWIIGLWVCWNHHSALKIKADCFLICAISYIYFLFSYSLNAIALLSFNPFFIQCLPHQPITDT